MALGGEDEHHDDRHEDEQAVEDPGAAVPQPDGQRPFAVSRSVGMSRRLLATSRAEAMEPDTDGPGQPGPVTSWACV